MYFKYFILAQLYQNWEMGQWVCSEYSWVLIVSVLIFMPTELEEVQTELRRGNIHTGTMAQSDQKHWRKVWDGSNILLHAAQVPTFPQHTGLSAVIRHVGSAYDIVQVSFKLKNQSHCNLHAIETLNINGKDMDNRKKRMNKNGEVRRKT